MNNISSAIKPKQKSSGDDRVCTMLLNDNSQLMLLADGAAGIGHGYLAAELFIKTCVNKIVSFPKNKLELADLIYNIDSNILTNRIDADTTGIIILVKNNQLLCTSVGDSQAWLLTPSRSIALTCSQSTRPRIGNACFVSKIEEYIIPLGSYIIMTSDGLLEICSTKKLFELVLKNKSASEIIKIMTNDGEQFDDLSLIIAKY